MTNHSSKTKQIAAAALALLCASSSAYAYEPMTGNCFRMTSGEEQAEGLPTFLPVAACSKENGEFCLRQGKSTVRPDFAGSTSYIPVPRCTKYDAFNQEEPDSDKDGIPDYEDADFDNDGSPDSSR
jgi:hypothetical protein